MPDITMCCNCNCPKRKVCYRYRAVPDQYAQSFALFKPEDTENCDHFWPVDEIKDKTLPTQIVDNRYERDGKWSGLLEDEDDQN